MTTLPMHSGVQSFVASVRAELADLSPEDLDDLTSGLEADLAERLKDSPSDPTVLADPVGYAAELRAAAGLPPRGGPVPRADTGGVFAALGSARRALWGRYVALVRTHSWLRDAIHGWWVLRGLLIGVLLAQTVFFYSGRPAVMAGFVIALAASWWLARRAPRARGLVILRLGSTLGAGYAALALAMSGWMSLPLPELAPPNEPSTVTYIPEPGMYLDGVQVANLFVYGPDGRRIDGARIFSELGDQITLASPFPDPVDPMNGGAGMERLSVFPYGVDGRSGWEPMEGWAPPLMLDPITPLSPSPEASAPASPTSPVSPSVSPTPSASPSASASASTRP